MGEPRKNNTKSLDSCLIFSQNGKTLKYTVHFIFVRPIVCLVPLSVRITAISLLQMTLLFDTDAASI
jgi:hypothetical protein